VAWSTAVLIDNRKVGVFLADAHRAAALSAEALGRSTASVPANFAVTCFAIKVIIASKLVAGAFEAASRVLTQIHSESRSCGTEYPSSIGPLLDGRVKTHPQNLSIIAEMPHLRPYRRYDS
jgi:hypothetical protein